MRENSSETFIKICAKKNVRSNNVKSKKNEYKIIFYFDLNALKS